MNPAPCDNRPIRLLAVIEARTVTGPAKNLLEYARLARTGEYGPAVMVSLAVFQREGGLSEFARAATDAGIPVHVIAERGRFDPAALRGLRELLIHEGPDVFQTHAVKSHFLARLTGEWRDRPWLAFHHGYTTTNLRMRIYNQLDRWSLRKADEVVTVSQAYARQLTGIGVRGDRIRVRHNAIDPNWGDRVHVCRTAGQPRAGLGIRPEERVILIVGRLSREKAHGDLVSAVHRLRQQFPDEAIRLAIAGEGPERQRIEAHAAALGVLDCVLFAGHVSDMTAWYAAADVCVLASATEGSPNALLESMAARIPVVATAVGGVPEMVRDEESALLVAPGDIAGMADAIGRILRDRDLADGLTERAHKLVLERHSPEARARWLSELYAEIVERWRRRDRAA
jgi:glycosyltransferase involved in cell wall biosynthesis